MKKIVRIFLCIVISLAPFSCQNDIQKGWIQVQNNDLYIWTEINDTNLTYNWEGGAFDKLIHGQGTLYTYCNDSLIGQKNITAYHGVISTTDIITLSDSSSYIGKLQKEMFEGFGFYQNGQDIYVGTFKKSKPHGHLNWYKNGTLYYQGQWEDGHFQNEGTLYKKDGNIKKGIWENGKLIQTYIKKHIPEGFYEGYVLNDKPDGIGSIQYKDSSCYTGEWSNGKWSGNGKYISRTDSITGEWHKGKLNGYGIYKNDKIQYNGEWLDNQPDGFGEMLSNDSSYYAGEWSHGKRNGYGNMYFTNSDTYFGDWTDNQFDGLGEYTYSQNGDYYHGEWKAGLQHGMGTYISKDFEYVGNWEEGWINGKGKITYANKDFYEGEFVENELYGQGYYQFHNGNSYDGEFVDGKFNGLGVFHFADGSVYEGEFQDGKIKGDGTLYYVEGQDTVIITAHWDGTNHFPKQASILFSNGDLYEGELHEGYPTVNGVWTSQEERMNQTIPPGNSITRANDFYKKHKATWNKFVGYTSTILTIIEIAPIIGCIMLATPITAPIGAALLYVGSASAVAGIANLALNTVDAAIKTTSAGIDTYEAIQNDGNLTEPLTNLGGQIAINAAFIVLPKTLKKSTPVRKASALLSSSARRIANRSLIVLNKNKVFGKIIGIAKDKSGKLQKSLKDVYQNMARNSMKSSLGKKFESTFLKKMLYKTLIYKQLQQIKAKGPIRLTKKEFTYLMANPNKANLKSFIKAKTGNEKNFMEFFIRLSDGDKKQVKMILEQSHIRKYIDNAIRSASGEKGYHEWLMTSNFKSFLIDTKWGEDGQFLALTLPQLIQQTQKIIFKYGKGGHVAAGRPNSPESIAFHNGLARIIHNCQSKEELFVNIRAYAKRALIEEAYKDFNNIFKNVLQTATD